MFSARLFRVLVTPTTQAQIEERAERSWKLRDLLHLGNLNTPGSTVGDDGYLMKTAAPPMKPTPVTRPTLVGKGNFVVVESPPASGWLQESQTVNKKAPSTNSG